MSVDDSTEQELIGYVSHCLKAGVPVSKIVSTLRSRGLSEESAFLLLEHPDFHLQDIPDLDGMVEARAEPARRVSAPAQAEINRRQVQELDEKIHIETEPLEIRARPAILAHRHDFLDYERRKRKSASSRRRKKKKAAPRQATVLKYLFFSLAASLCAAIAFIHFKG